MDGRSDPPPPPPVLVVPGFVPFDEPFPPPPDPPDPEDPPGGVETVE